MADDSYDTPTGSATTFSTTTSDPADGPGSGDANSWDVTLTALQTYLAGHDLVYLVASNQVGGAGTDLLAWGRVTLINPSDPLLTPICFDLNNTRNTSPLSYGPITGAACSVPPVEPSGSSTGDFLTVLGRFCLDPVTGAVVDCSTVGAIGPFDSNVGNNEFDFALFSPELNNLQTYINQGYTVAQHWFELRNLNDGDETVAICDFCDIAVPSPQALLLVVSGALYAIATRGTWRRRTAAC